MTATQHPVPVNRPLPVAQPRAITQILARQAIPILAGSAAALVTTLAAERTLANLALRALDRATDALPRRSGRASRVYHTRVIETLVVERISRRS